MSTDSRVSSEFALTLATARIAPSATEIERARALCATPIDWGQFFATVDRHGLAVPVFLFLSRRMADVVPPDTLEKLESASQRSRAASLRLAGELALLARALSGEGIGFTALKGPLLSQAMFGDPGLRESHDLDILVSPQQLAAAEAVLRAQGFVRANPRFDLTPRQHREFVRVFHHFTFTRRSGDSRSPRLQVELHWRLMTNPFWMPPAAEAEMIARADSVALPGGASARRLAPLDQVLYLLLHGAHHRWSQLKWLFDVAEAFKRWRDLDWAAFAARVRDLRLDVVVGLGASLARDLLGAPLPAPIAALAAPSRRMAALARASLVELTVVGEPFSLKLRRLPYRLQLKPDWRYRGYVLFDDFFLRTSDWHMLDLPDSLFPLNYPLRPVVWAGRRLRLVK